jgi:hypothetical protein
MQKLQEENHGLHARLLAERQKRQATAHAMRRELERTQLRILNAEGDAEYYSSAFRRLPHALACDCHLAELGLKRRRDDDELEYYEV